MRWFASSAGKGKSGALRGCSGLMSVVTFTKRPSPNFSLTLPYHSLKKKGALGHPQNSGYQATARVSIKQLNYCADASAATSRPKSASPTVALSSPSDSCGRTRPATAATASSSLTILSLLASTIITCGRAV